MGGEINNHDDFSSAYPSSIGFKINDHQGGIKGCTEIREGNSECGGCTDGGGDGVATETVDNSFTLDAVIMIGECD